MNPFPRLPQPSLRAAFAAILLLAGCGEGDRPEDAEAPAAPAAVPAPTPTPTPPGGRQVVDLATLGYDEGDTEGAPIRIVEFSDFGCVYCARFHMNDYAVLRDEFVEGGDVAWKYMPITVGGFPNGTMAAITAECVGEQGEFAPIRDLLYEERGTWLEATPVEADALFRGYAESVGADMGAWDRCLTRGDAASRVDLSNQVAAELGVQATPTFIIQGYPVQGAPALADFQNALRQMAAEIRGSAPPPPPSPPSSPPSSRP